LSETANQVAFATPAVATSALPAATSASKAALTVQGADLPAAGSVVPKAALPAVLALPIKAQRESRQANMVALLERSLAAENILKQQV
jgi:hypothetical protein